MKYFTISKILFDKIKKPDKGSFCTKIALAQFESWDDDTLNRKDINDVDKNLRWWYIRS